jgi:hypothetical protein
VQLKEACNVFQGGELTTATCAFAEALYSAVLAKLEDLLEGYTKRNLDYFVSCIGWQSKNIKIK